MVPKILSTGELELLTDRPPRHLLKYYDGVPPFQSRIEVSSGVEGGHVNTRPMQLACQGHWAECGVGESTTVRLGG